MNPLNKTEQKKRRQYLRKNMTRAEKLLWSKLRSQNLSDLKFRRQYGIGNYVVDFYCPELKLAIEIDGDVHGYIERIETDNRRANYIHSLGIRILRFTNQEIIESMESVLQSILSNLPQTPSFIRRGRKPPTSNEKHND
jgi:very-short-patch-repair endonuclease